MAKQILLNGGQLVSPLRKKIFRNLSGYAYSQGITLAAQILVVPFFLMAWGVQQYGEWLVLTGVPMFLALMELGVAQASATRAAHASGRQDFAAVRQSLDTAMAFSVAAALCVALLGTFLALSLPWANLLDLIDIDADSARSVFICMSFYLAGNFLAGPVSAWLKAIDRTALSAFWMANRRAAEVAVTVVTLCLGAGPVELAASLMLTSFLTVVLCYLIALRQSTVGAMTLRHASLQEIRTVFWPAVSFMAQPLAQIVTLQGGVQLLNILAGGAAVAAFSMARTMVRLLMQVGAVFNNAMRPEVSRLLGQGQARAACDVVKKGSKLASALVFAGLIGVALLGAKVLQIWSGGKVILPTEFLLLLSLHAVANVLWFVSSTLLFAQNRHSIISWSYMSFSILSLTIWWFSSSQIDPMSGAAIMMLMPEIFMIGLIVNARRSISKEN
ncbi:polysaccharide biosynthesis protein [Stutzerimonas stutzeri B1SMN1]|nr:polysaccharide biosynthesis protein [Stutzerimonas stutzeri B1SMN1]